MSQVLVGPGSATPLDANLLGGGGGGGIGYIPTILTTDIFLTCHQGLL